MPPDPSTADAFDLSVALQAGGLTSSDLVEQTLDRIDRIDPVLNAFVHVDREGARAAAAAASARRRAGATFGPLDGIPVAIKDNLFVKGMPARWGSRMFADFVPAEDDICVERLRAAGCVIVGKTATPEFALSSRTQSLLSGVTRNPCDPRLTPGGSSGGSVAAVAAGMVALALGTDAGGSIRNPAGLTGLIGLRPSTARVPRRFGFPPMAIDFQVIGLATRTVRDLRLLYDVLAGPDSRDPASTRLPAGPGPDRPIIGSFNSVADIVCDDAVLSAFDAALAALSHVGCDIRACAAPYDLGALGALWGQLTASAIARVGRTLPSGWEDRATPSIAAAAARGAALSAADYVEALDRLAMFRARTSEAWGDADYMVCPVSPAPAWPADREHPDSIGGRPGRPGDQDAFCGWVNAMALPAISLPVTPHPDGRPIGLQIVGRYGSDAGLMHLARQLEQSPVWSSRVLGLGGAARL